MQIKQDQSGKENSAANDSGNSAANDYQIFKKVYFLLH